MDFVQNGRCEVVLATSNDDRYPASNIIDNQNETFWVSTGMFPQEVMLRLNLDDHETTRPTLARLSRIEIHSTNIKHLVISISTKKVASQFETVLDTILEERDGKVQVEVLNLKGTLAHYINFQILSGWDNFVSISRISVEGETDNE